MSVSGNLASGAMRCSKMNCAEVSTRSSHEAQLLITISRYQAYGLLSPAALTW